MSHRTFLTGSAPRLRTMLLLAALGAMAPSTMARPATGADATPAGTSDNASDNPGIVRWVRGTYVYSAISDGHATGRENFTLTVAPDGVRTMRASTDIFSRGVQADVVMRVAPSFRPLDAYASISTNGVLKGSGLFIAGADTLTSTIVDAAGHIERATTPIPEKFSLGTHPLALDGWSGWYLAPVVGQVTKGTILLLNGDARNSRPMLAEPTPVDLLYLGEERVTVPAGTFIASHFRVAGMSDLWTTGEDRLLVKYVWRAIDRQYQLASLSVSRGTKPGQRSNRETKP